MFCLRRRILVPIVSILFGLVLIVLGLDGYLDLIGVVRPAEQAPTSLIPAYLGAFLVFCGLLAINPRYLKHAMHAAAAAALLGLLAGAIRGLPRVAQFSAENGAAPREQLLMAGLCLAFVLLCANSFVQVRRKRKTAAASPAVR
jgi:hypothetical protein